MSADRAVRQPMCVTSRKRVVLNQSRSGQWVEDFTSDLPASSVSYAREALPTCKSSWRQPVCRPGQTCRLTKSVKHRLERSRRQEAAQAGAQLLSPVSDKTQSFYSAFDLVSDFDLKKVFLRRCKSRDGGTQELTAVVGCYLVLQSMPKLGICDSAKTRKAGDTKSACSSI